MVQKIHFDVKNEIWGWKETKIVCRQSEQNMAIFDKHCHLILFN